MEYPNDVSDMAVMNALAALVDRCGGDILLTREDMLCASQKRLEAVTTPAGVRMVTWEGREA